MQINLIIKCTRIRTGKVFIPNPDPRLVKTFGSDRVPHNTCDYTVTEKDKINKKGGT